MFSVWGRFGGKNRTTSSALFVSIFFMLLELSRKTLSTLQDALTHRLHSQDFAYARSEYLRMRVLVVGALFLVLLPFWTALDWFMLPRESLSWVLTARLGMAIVLLGVLILAYRSKAQLHVICLLAGTLLATPACFYALVLIGLPPGATLIGYSFIPGMLVGMLAVFPFTLLESLVMGLMLMALEAYALYVSGTLGEPAGLQALWLLAALLSIAMTANYFQLGLMLRLHREATHDPLTGLLNRGALLRSMLQLVQRKPAPQAALLMMDLDHFKRINDQFGHMAGDDVLKGFTRMLSQHVRPMDVAARYGGEEFIAVLIDTPLQEATRIAELIRLSAEGSRLEDVQGRHLRFTVSIGVAMLEPGFSFTAAVRQADERLYEAKKRGRNCVVGGPTS